MKKFYKIVYGIILFCLGFVLISDGMERYEGVQSMKTLRPCPSSPNCVSSQAEDPQHHMEPIPYAGSRDQAQAKLRTILQIMPRSQIMKDEPGYLDVYFRSRIFGFVDELEFLFDERNGLIHFRSGAHTGYYDFGVNRSRMRLIAEAFNAAK
ncbi:MAG: DUF1499 domain-containing protein [Deltaproteobacteria bacterium HGW-Deltaproteobacteria-13]|jgi:uncharacterized protein (DUF1499 family)|nr:MAG: DUF1499 domain-containing protein [Deltaproteobacteria bacterium HGW-Deltaproteobacteria-13]